jgi:hypothetical protein
VTGDHVSVVFAGGFVHTTTTEIAVVRHFETFGTTKIAKKKNKKVTKRDKNNVFDGKVNDEKERKKKLFF